MNFNARIALVAVAGLALTAPAFAKSNDAMNPMVGGHAMDGQQRHRFQTPSTPTITRRSSRPSRRPASCRRFRAPGPFTVFAPTNEAFNALPAGTVDTLLKPENKATLTKILTYHVVAGKLDFAALQGKIQAGGGKAELATVQGEMLTLAMNGPRNITVTDSKGNVAQIETYDVYQSNGVIQVIDHVLMP